MLKQLFFFTILSIVFPTNTAFTNVKIRQNKHEFSLAAVKRKRHDKGKLQKYFPCIDIGDIPDPGMSVSAVANGVPICIAVDRVGGVFALEDKCSIHTLSTGLVHDDGFIEDTMFGTKFSLDTGMVLDGQWCCSRIGRLIGRNHKPQNVKVFPIRHKGRHLELQMAVDSNDMEQN